MQISSQQALPASQENAWAALNNIEVLKACIPGCESLTETDSGRYEVLITAAIGPVKAKFKGKLGLTDMKPPESYTINFEGQGGAAGHGKGSAKVRPEDTGNNRSVLHTPLMPRLAARSHKSANAWWTWRHKKWRLIFLKTSTIRSCCSTLAQWSPIWRQAQMQGKVTGAALKIGYACGSVKLDQRLKKFN